MSQDDRGLGPIYMADEVHKLVTEGETRSSGQVVGKPEIVFLLQHAGAIRFIESFCRDLYGVLNISNILYRNCARYRAPLGRSNFSATMRVAPHGI